MISRLSADNEEYLNRVVKDGAYQDQREALDEAVALLRKRDQLRADVRAGIRQADRGELVPAEAVFERLEERARLIERKARGEQ